MIFSKGCPSSGHIQCFLSNRSTSENVKVEKYTLFWFDRAAKFSLSGAQTVPACTQMRSCLKKKKKGTVYISACLCCVDSSCFLFTITPLKVVELYLHVC